MIRRICIDSARQLLLNVVVAISSDNSIVAALSGRRPYHMLGPGISSKFGEVSMVMHLVEDTFGRAEKSTELHSSCRYWLGPQGHC